MKVYKEDNEAIPAVIIQDDATAAPSDYTEVTDIEGIAEFGVKGIDESTAGWRDKKAVRKKLKQMVLDKAQMVTEVDREDDAKFALLSAAEQTIALKWLILVKEEWQMSEVNDDKYWTVKGNSYRNNSMNDRKKRLRTIEALIFRRLRFVYEAKDVLLDMSQILEGTPIPIDSGTNKTTSKVNIRKMQDSYVEGVEGTLEDNAGSFIFESLLDYIDSRTGTSFSGKGFRDLSHTFRGTHTATAVADELLTIADGSW